MIGHDVGPSPGLALQLLGVVLQTCVISSIWPLLPVRLPIRPSTLVRLLPTRERTILGVFTAYIVPLLQTESYPCVDENGICVLIALLVNFRLCSLDRTVRFALPGRFLPDRLNRVRSMLRLPMAFCTLLGL